MQTQGRVNEQGDDVVLEPDVDGAAIPTSDAVPKRWSFHMTRTTL